MSLNLKIYQYDGDHRVLEKQLPTPTALTGAFRDSVDIMHPTVLVERTAISGNYVFIDSPVNRYYYIDEITQERTGLQLLHLREDVLKTFAAQIKNMPGVIWRNAVWSDPDLYDPDLQRKQKTQAYMAAVGSAFTYSSRMIFVTVG